MTRELTRRNFLKVSAGMLAGSYALTFAGCGESGEGSAPSVVRLIHGQPQWQDFYAKMGELCSRATRVGIKPVPYSDVTAFQQVIQQSLRAGGEETPDLFYWWSGYRLDGLAREDGLEDVTSIWDSQIEEGNLAESLQAAFTYEGQQYAVPAIVSYYPVFYNKKVFREQGLAPPRSWDELLSIADRLKKAGVTPFYATIDGRWPSFLWFEELMIRSDPDFYDRLMHGEESYTDPFVVDVFEEWRSMIEAGYFSNLDIPMDSRVVDEFASGKIAMILIGTWFNSSISAGKLKPVEDYGAFMLPNVNPALKENVVVAETGALGVATNSPDIDAGKRVAEWWVSPEAQTRWSEMRGDTPTNPKVKPSNPLLAEVVSTVRDGNYRLMQRFWEATLPQIAEAAVDEFARFMLNPGQYMDVLKTIEGIAQREWSNYRQ